MTQEAQAALSPGLACWCWGGLLALLGRRRTRDCHGALQLRCHRVHRCSVLRIATAWCFRSCARGTRCVRGWGAHTRRWRACHKWQGSGSCYVVGGRLAQRQCCHTTGWMHPTFATATARSTTSRPMPCVPRCASPCPRAWGVVGDSIAAGSGLWPHSLPLVVLDDNARPRQLCRSDGGWPAPLDVRVCRAAHMPDAHRTG